MKITLKDIYNISNIMKAAIKNINFPTIEEYRKKPRKIKKLGQGANGKVFLYTSKDDGKFVRKYYFKGDEKRRRRICERELNIYSKIENIEGVPKIIRHSINDPIFIDTTYIDDSINLYELHKCLGNKDAIEISLKVIDIVKNCHMNDIIHRDIKLENVIVSWDKENVNLIDWDCSYHPDNEFTMEFGTVLINPPEMFKNVYEDKYKIDVWQIGCLLYSLLVKKDSFVGNEKLSPSEDEELKENIINCNWNKTDLVLCQRNHERLSLIFSNIFQEESNRCNIDDLSIMLNNYYNDFFN